VDELLALGGGERREQVVLGPVEEPVELVEAGGGRRRSA
jgi:hypothetical protein